ncbi:copper resistance protein NlpE N-terminal domain-containing protein [Limibacter armeniacum]|uniref:copper resistance protein NlpE N-terminal domain-containing protein n=1 Tax=Limibacter armeniacum TaxID=466084 RepID=UPI002FE5370A
MKKKQLFALIGAAMITFASCQNKGETKEDQSAQQHTTMAESNKVADAAHNSANALDWNGTYEGVIPCADCEGIEISLVLNNDETYLLTTKYLGKADDIFRSSGKFVWNEMGSIVTLEGVEAPNQYFVGENALFKLDKEGNRVIGDLASKYMLSKKMGDVVVQEGLLETKWKLVELAGQPLTDEKEGDIPFLMLMKEDSRLSAFAGCNNIMGAYELSEGNRITFSQMASTQKACPDMEVEKNFVKALEMADNFTLKDGTLSLNRARMAPLARFEKVEE